MTIEVKRMSELDGIAYKAIQADGTVLEFFFIYNLRHKDREAQFGRYYAFLRLARQQEHTLLRYEHIKGYCNLEIESHPYGDQSGRFAWGEA